MERMRVVCFHIWSSEGGSSRLCQLRTASVGPYCNKHWLCTGAYEIYKFPANLVSSTVTELDNTLPRFTDVQWDSARVTHGLPIEVLTWKTALGRGRTQPDSLIVIAKGATRVASMAHVCHVIRLFSFARWLFIQISTTPSDMGEACSLRPNVEMVTTLLVCGDHWMMLTIL
jgi:hypothetical protein